MMRLFGKTFPRLLLLATLVVAAASAPRVSAQTDTWGDYSQMFKNSAGQHFSGADYGGQWTWTPQNSTTSDISWAPNYAERMIKSGNWILLDGYNNGPGTAITQVQRVTSEKIGDVNCNNMQDLPPENGGMQHYAQWSIPSTGYCLDATGTIKSPTNNTTVNFRHRQQWYPAAACSNTYFSGKTCISQHEQWWDDNNHGYQMTLDRSGAIAKGLGMAFKINQTFPSNWSSAGKYYNQSLDGTTVWSPATGAHQIYGEIAKKWKAMSAFNGPQGYPTSDEASTPNGAARYNNMQNGGIYWSSATGAQAIYGAIYQKWAQFGYEGGILRLPTTSESITPDGIGRYNHFQGVNGSIYWTAATNAHVVQGSIKSRWSALGWEKSYLGYPTSDEYAIPGGRRSDFQGGYITYNASTGQVTDIRTSTIKR